MTTIDDIQKDLSDFFKGYEVLVEQDEPESGYAGIDVLAYDMVYVNSEWKKIAFRKYLSVLDLGGALRVLTMSEKFDIKFRLSKIKEDVINKR